MSKARLESEQERIYIMKKKFFILLFSLLLVIVVGGFIFNKEDDERFSGLSNEYDVSPQNTIAYIVYSDGKPQLLLYNEEKTLKKTVAEFDENTLIFDPTFSKDGTVLAYVTSNKNKETELESTVHFLDMKTFKLKEVFTDHSTITEIDFKPDQSSLFYLRAGTFENYSPITGERPHEFDVFEYHLEKKSHAPITNLKQYSMESLHAAPSGDKIYIQRIHDDDVKTAEDSFEAKQKIFEIPLAQPEQAGIVSNPDRQVDIYDFDITPEGTGMIFQSISNSEEGGTFEYELYQYDLKSKQEKQLTRLGQYVGNPVISSDGKTIYFMLDKNFAKGDPVHHLYKMNPDGDYIKEVELPTSMEEK